MPLVAWRECTSVAGAILITGNERSITERVWRYNLKNLQGEPAGVSDTHYLLLRSIEVISCARLAQRREEACPERAQESRRVLYQLSSAYIRHIFFVTSISIDQFFRNDIILFWVNEVKRRSHRRTQALDGSYFIRRFCFLYFNREEYNTLKRLCKVSRFSDKNLVRP